MYIHIKIFKSSVDSQDNIISPHVKKNVNILCIDLTGWGQCPRKWMEICCHGTWQGLSDSLHIFYNTTFCCCFNRSSACNCSLKKNAIKVEDIDYRPPQVILEKEGEDMFSQHIFRRTFMHLLHICLSLLFC